MQDQNFPVIQIENPTDYLNNGRAHGELFREGIIELIDIRKSLMLNKNPNLKNSLKELANEQFLASQKYSPSIT